MISIWRTCKRSERGPSAHIRGLQKTDFYSNLINEDSIVFGEYWSFMRLLRHQNTMGNTNLPFHAPVQMVQ